MTLPRPYQAPRLLLLVVTIGLAGPTRLTAQEPVSRPVVLLDPAHGGPDTGAHLSDHLLEKELTLAFATRLRTLLTTDGFTVITTRDSDPAAVFSTDERAEIANHAHPTACLILHATTSGAGVHLVTSALTSSKNDADTADSDAHSPTAIPWNTAQAASIPHSLSLSNQLGLALLHAKLPVTLTRSSLHPLDNLTCPAVAIEIAPPVGGDRDAVSAADYQQQVAQAIAEGLTAWRSHENPGAAR